MEVQIGVIPFLIILIGRVSKNGEAREDRKIISTRGIFVERNSIAIVETGIRSLLLIRLRLIIQRSSCSRALSVGES